jgi:hypothetical protein
MKIVGRGMKKKNKKILTFLIAVFILIGVLCGYLFYKSQDLQALKFKRYVKYLLVPSKLPVIPEEEIGLTKIRRTQVYENNFLVSRNALNINFDNKKIYITDNKKRLVDYTNGFLVDIPKNVEFDFSYSPLRTSINGKDFSLLVTKEYSPYENVEEYFNFYLNRFITNEEYQKANNITLIEKRNVVYNGNQNQIITVKINDLDKSKFDGYTYVTVKTNNRLYYRLMFKYNTKSPNINNIIEDALKSFSYFVPIGESVYSLDLKPVENKKWSKETRALYVNIANSKKPRFGIFTKDIYGVGINKTVPEIENKFDYKFPVILSYVHFKAEFPLEFMRKNYENGKIVELTYQITESNNEKLFGYTPNIDTYRGKKDDEIRKFAKKAKEFGHPFLFRLNNEMNSDWTSYSGVINMSDPDIYIDNWRRIYKIFEEEGVNNAIWIFNPNDRNYPPCNWNNFLAYYPGNEYVQMIGLTGYNTGTYYKETFLEEWREFEAIYNEVQDKYAPFFSDFPWIITEFSSSSIGGDKAKWVDNMFKCIEKYKNIKIAVWFSYADFDFRDEYKGKQARPYWIDDSEETIQAFKNWLKIKCIEGWN